KRWIADVKAQGGTSLYVIASDDVGPGNPFATIVPIEDAAKAKAMASLLYSGTTTGPSAPPAGGAKAPYQRFIKRAEVIPGVGVVRGTSDRIAAAKAIVAKPRPDLDAALKAAGNAPVKFAIAATPKLTGNMRGAPMPIQTALKNTKWIVATIDAPPT